MEFGYVSPLVADLALHQRLVDLRFMMLIMLNKLLNDIRISKVDDDLLLRLLQAPHRMDGHPNEQQRANQQTGIPEHSHNIKPLPRKASA